MEPLVSVIMAAYNSEKYIKISVESILNQTYKNIEFIICDDGSTDNTWNILNSMAERNSNIVLIKNEVNKKAAYSRNQCIEISRGKYIAIQDADDISHPDRIRILANILEVQTNIDFVSSGMKLFDENGVRDIVTPSKMYPEKKDFLMGVPFAHPPTMFRREALLSVGGYRVSKETTRGEDADLFMRLYAQGFKGMNVSEPLYYYREDLNAILRRSLKFRIDAARINIKNFRLMGLMPAGYIFALKPVISWFLPHTLIYKLRRKRGNFN
jgi:Glycosyltransferases, probably involved in cell wall biogenesis